MIITKLALPRRTFLRGIGAAVALPLLDAMVPALSAASRTAATPARRLRFVYIPNGAIMDQWTPVGDGKAFEFAPIMKSLDAHREQVVVVSNLASRPAEAAEGEGSGDHARASAVWLTGIHPKRTEGADVRGGKTIDQIAADKLGQDTQLRSMEIAAEDFTAVGGCDIGYACSYVNTLSWRTPTTPWPMQTDPRVGFERLFGEGLVDEHLQSHRRARSAPRDLPSRQRAGQDREAREDQRVPHEPVRALPRSAEGDAGRRRHAPRSLAPAVRRLHQQRQPPHAFTVAR